MTYYNTNKETGEVLKKSRIKAKTQEDKIYDWFSLHPNQSFTPGEIRELFPNRVPITSIRRAITDLTTKGYLTKNDEKRVGSYGKGTHTWSFNSNF